VSVVMPYLNEAGAVGQCVRTARQTLKDINVPAEVIVVDNGSIDGSEIAEQAGARVIHERCRRYGAAYLRGFQEAQGKYLVMGDSDCSNEFTDIPHFIEPLARSEYDMVIGTPGAMPWSHHLDYTG
jgi:glycosyltransferase involved in cell wall biosynthesis